MGTPNNKPVTHPMVNEWAWKALSFIFTLLFSIACWFVSNLQADVKELQNASHTSTQRHSVAESRLEEIRERCARIENKVDRIVERGRAIDRAAGNP